jgi:hypothetical protein
MTRKFIQFEVTPEMHQSIRSTCAEMCISISQFMREATGVYLNLDRCPGSEATYGGIDRVSKIDPNGDYPSIGYKDIIKDK